MSEPARPPDQQPAEHPDDSLACWLNLHRPVKQLRQRDWNQYIDALEEKALDYEALARTVTDLEAENASLRNVLAEVSREQSRQLDVILARLKALASVSVPPQDRAVMRPCCERHVTHVGVLSPTTCGECGNPLQVRNRKWRVVVPPQDTDKEPWKPRDEDGDEVYEEDIRGADGVF